MAAYAVTDLTAEYDSPELAAAGMETLLETIDDTKTIRLAKILPTASGKYMVIIIHDA